MTPSDEIEERKYKSADEYADITCYYEPERSIAKIGYEFGLEDGKIAGFDQAIKMLRSFKDERNSLRIPAQHMADWLQNNKPRGVK